MTSSHTPKDHISHTSSPFYVGVTLESLHLQSTYRGPEPGTGDSAASSLGLAAPPPADVTDSDEEVSSEGARDGQTGWGIGRVASGSLGRGGRNEHLVKKVVQLNHLAVYWNPAEAGNPCSIHVSDLPVEEAEVVICR
ncbi:unnamed protein product [Choristocarpus tenellus]